MHPAIAIRSQSVAATKRYEQLAGPRVGQAELDLGNGFLLPGSLEAFANAARGGVRGRLLAGGGRAGEQSLDLAELLPQFVLSGHSAMRPVSRAARNRHLSEIVHSIDANTPGRKSGGYGQSVESIEA